MEWQTQFAHFFERAKHSDWFQLTGFLLVQILGLGVALSSVHFIQTRETHLVNLRLQQQNAALRENVIDQFEIIDNFADEVRQRLTEEYSWWEQRGDSINKILRESVTKSVPQVKSVRIFDADGVRYSTSETPIPPVVEAKDREYFKQMKYHNIDKAQFGPYISRTYNTLTYAVIRKLTSKEGVFVGTLAVNLNTSYFERLCKSALPSDAYESYLLTPEGKVMLWCSFTKTHPEAFGKSFKDMPAGKGYNATEIAKTDKLTYETETHILAVNTLPGYYPLKIVSTVSRSASNTAVHGVLWQIYLLLLTVVLTQIASFTLFRQALKSMKLFWVSAEIPTTESLMSIHSEWKEHFKGAIAEKLPLDADSVGNSHTCRTGRWIITQVGQYKFLQSYMDLVAAHDKLHQEAKKIAILVNREVFAAAEQALEEGSSYDKASKEVDAALNRLLADIARLEANEF